MDTWALLAEGQPRRSRLRALVSDRISPPLCAAHRLPGAGSGRHSAGPLVEEERQVRRIRADDPAGVRVLRRFAGRSFAGAARQGLPVVRGLAGRLRVPRAGVFLLSRAEKRPFELASFRAVLEARPVWTASNGVGRRRENAFERASTRRRVFSASFPTLLDDYVLRDFFVYLGLILSTFLVLVLVFTLFELLGDILRNQVPATVVAEYLLNVAPYLLYNVAPLVMLLAVLVTFGLMQRSNEITAIKATGTSIYRIVTPVIVAAAVLGGRIVFRRPVLSAPHQQAPGSAAQPDQGQAAANLSAPRPQMDFRPEQRHLLLPIFRSRPRPVRQHHASSNSTRPASPSPAAFMPTAPTGPKI